MLELRMYLPSCILFDLMHLLQIVLTCNHEKKKDIELVLESTKRSFVTDKHDTPEKQKFEMSGMMVLEEQH